jgi:hypothetical protein
MSTTTAATAAVPATAPTSRRRVRVVGPPDGENRETYEAPAWFACCTDADWSQPGGRGCNWYGEYRQTKAEAKADAARHRRTHSTEVSR